MANDSAMSSPCGRDERHHVTHAGHQVRPQPDPEVRVVTTGRGSTVPMSGGAGRQDGGLAAFRLLPGFGDQLGRAVDPRLDPGVDDRLAVEPCLLAHLDVMCPDDRVGGGDQRRIEPLEPGRALRLDIEHHAPGAGRGRQ